MSLDKAKIFSVAEKAILKGQYDKALESLEQILKADPLDSKALNRAADIYLKKNDTQKGVDCLKRLGESYSRDGFFSKAVAIYKRILKLDNIGSKEDLVEIHEKLADLYGQLGLVSDSMAHFQIVVEIYDRQSNHEALLKVLKKVSDLDPYNIDSQLKLAELFKSQGMEPSAQESLARLAEHVVAKGHDPDIIRVFEKWTEFFPKDFQRLKELVDHYFRVQEPKKALARIQTAFKADPRAPEVLELLSQTFVNLKQPDKARAVDVELLKIYRQKGLDGEAQATEERIKGKAPDFSSPGLGAKISQAQVADDQLDPAEALISIEKLDPEERKIISECDVYIKYGLMDKAQEVLSKNISKFPQSLAMRWKLKSIYLDQAQVDLATHLVSEVAMLAKSKNLSDWSRLASDELAKIDPRHPALAGAPASSAKSKPKPDEAVIDLESSKDKTGVEEIEFQDFESSEVSIVLEDEVIEPSEKSRGTQSQEPMSLELEPAMPTSELDESQVDGTGGEAFLTESDFSPEELQKLQDNLTPATSDVFEINTDSGIVNEPSVVAIEVDSGPIMIESESEPLSRPPNKAPAAQVQTAVRESKPESHPKNVGADFEIKQALEEVSFFRQQGLASEANQLMKTLLIKHPGHPLIVEAAKASGQSGHDRLKKQTLELETLGRKVKLSVQADERQSGDDSFFDLGAELDAELGTSNPSLKTEGPAEVREVFKAFKSGVAQAVAADDWQTHLDLGIAYREMGLLDDAIEEFKIVSSVKAQEASAFYQMGVCEIARGRFKEAKSFFDQALAQPEIMDQERLSVTYELADCLLQLNDRKRAKMLFEEVKKLDPEFRELQERLKALA